MRKLFVLNYLTDANNSLSLNNASLVAPGLRPGTPSPARAFSIQAALARAEFQFHRVCSSCELNTGRSVSYGTDRSMMVERDVKNVISVEDVVGEGSAGSALSTTADSENVAGAVGATSRGMEPTSMVTLVDSPPSGRPGVRSTSQQTIVSCRCSSGSVSVVEGGAPGAGAATLPSGSILGSVCALLLNKRGACCGPGLHSVSDAEKDAAGRRSDQICRICFGGESDERLVRPCSCRGTIAAVHRSCLERWLQQAASSYCELCRHHYLVTRTHKWSWARSTLEWAVSGRGRALAADALRGAALAAASVVGTARALHLCDRVLSLTSRRGGSAALAANVFSSLLIGIIGALNGLLTTWILLKIQEHRASWRAWRDSTLHVHVTLEEDAATSPAPCTPPSPHPVRLDRSTNVADPFMVASSDGETLI